MNALADGPVRQRLADFVRERAHARGVAVLDARALSGGAIQENWRVDLDIEGGEHAGRLSVVLRCDAATVVAASHGRLQEFALLRAAFEAGVTVPEPLWACDDLAVIGRPFFVMRLIAGTADAQLLTKDDTYGGDRRVLAARIGREMGLLHAIKPQPPRPELGLDDYDEAPALRLVHKARGYLDTLHDAHPVLEWALRWLERHAPPRGELVLCHRDFRTGNYMVAADGFSGVLDWEFAGFSDPMEDLGWFCARCWRFARPDREAGGIGDRRDLYAGYESVTGVKVDDAQVRYWEVMAHVNWAIIALQQAARHMSGDESSLLLALTGYIVPELEWELLKMTGGGAGDEAAPSGFKSTVTREQPDGADLLHAARALFQAELLPGLSGVQRHAGRMIMRAMDLAMRQLQAGEEPARFEVESLAALFPGGRSQASPLGKGASAQAVADTLTPLNRGLVDAIRRGDADPGEPLQDSAIRHLRAVTRRHVARSNPRVLEAKDR